MTAVLSAAARAALYGVLGAALVLVCVAAMLWPAYGPQGLWTVAWLGVTAVTVAGCGAAWEWLGNRRRGRHAMSDRIERAAPGLVCPGCGSPDVDLGRGLLCGTCAEAAAPAGGGSDE